MSANQTCDAQAAGRVALHLVVSLRLSELVILVQALRERAYDCRRLADASPHEIVKRKALEAAQLLDERANELAQANAELTHPAAK